MTARRSAGGFPERRSRSSFWERRGEETTLNYSFTVEDPNTWEAAWSGEFPWPAAGGRVYEYACHEGNYAMGNIMRGARLLETDAAGAATGGE